MPTSTTTLAPLETSITDPMDPTGGTSGGTTDGSTDGAPSTLPHTGASGTNAAGLGLAALLAGGGLIAFGRRGPAPAAGRHRATTARHARRVDRRH